MCFLLILKFFSTFLSHSEGMFSLYISHLVRSNKVFSPLRPNLCFICLPPPHCNNLFVLSSSHSMTASGVPLSVRSAFAPVGVCPAALAPVPSPPVPRIRPCSSLLGTAAPSVLEREVREGIMSQRLCLVKFVFSVINLFF